VRSSGTHQSIKCDSTVIQLTIYSDGAINSMVEDLISGLLVGSPYVLLTGSYWNSSGTAKVKIKHDLNLLHVILYYAFNNHKRSHMVENVLLQHIFHYLAFLYQFILYHLQMLLQLQRL
jgi:hypothetical protein